MLTRDELGEVLLVALAERERLIAATPDPLKWRTWDAEELRLDREYGPRYSPTWLDCSTEAQRVRLLRVVNKLHDADLLTICTSEHGRLSRLKLTEAGKAAVAALAAAASQTPDPAAAE